MELINGFVVYLLVNLLFRLVCTFLWGWEQEQNVWLVLGRLKATPGT